MVAKRTSKKLRFLRRKHKEGKLKKGVKGRDLVRMAKSRR